MLEAHSAMPPLCLARHLGALAEGPCPSARPSVPSALGPSFCFRAFRPGPVVREVYTSQGYARPMLHVRADPAGSALTCLVASVALCPAWGLAPFWRLMAHFPCASHTPLLATNERLVGGVFCPHFEDDSAYEPLMGCVSHSSRLCHLSFSRVNV